MSEQGWKRTVLVIAAVVFMSLVADQAASSAATLTVPALPSPTAVTQPVTNTARTLTSPIATPPAPAPTATAPVKKVVAPVVKKVTSPTATSPTRTVTSPTRTVTAPVSKIVGTTPTAPRHPALPGLSTPTSGTAPSAGSPGGIVGFGGNGPTSPSSGPVAQLLLPGSAGGAPGGTGTAPFALFGSPAAGTGQGGRPGGGGSGGVAAAEVAAFVASLKSCLMGLPSQDRDFLIFRAGLDGGGVRSRSAIARALGIAPSRGAAVERRALGRLNSAAARGECGTSGGTGFAAGLFLGPTFLGSPLGTLLGPAQRVKAKGAETAQPVPAGYNFGRSFSDTLRSLGDADGTPGSLWVVAVILLFLFGSVAALMRETRRSI